MPACSLIFNEHVVGLMFVPDRWFASAADSSERSLLPALTVISGACAGLVSLKDGRRVVPVCRIIDTSPLSVCQCHVRSVEVGRNDIAVDLSAGIMGWIF